MTARRVIVLGATGLVGRELIQQLLADDDVSEVVAIGRRRPEGNSPKLHPHVFPLEEMRRHSDIFGADQLFCALGTTIKKAGSQAEFRRIDHDIPLEAARLALERGTRHFLLVSAMGANSRSRIFYNRVKGELEDDLRSLGFPSLTIARPSLLLGPREERRLGEEIAKRFGWLMRGKYRPIEARDVAHALLSAARADSPGVQILESAVMQR